MNFNDLSIGDEFVIVSYNIAQIGLASRKFKLTSTHALELSFTSSDVGSESQTFVNILRNPASVVDRSSNPEVIKVNRQLTA